MTLNLEAIKVNKDELHVDSEPVHDYHYFDENTGKALDPRLVKIGDDREIAKLRGRGVYDHGPFVCPHVSWFEYSGHRNALEVCQHGALPACALPSCSRSSEKG